jgi:hypothetical protein
MGEVAAVVDVALVVTIDDVVEGDGIVSVVFDVGTGLPVVTIAGGIVGLGAAVVTVAPVVGFLAGVVGNAGLEEVPGTIDARGTHDVKINTIANIKAISDNCFFIISSPSLFIFN